jgi:hypothetical protein
MRDADTKLSGNSVRRHRQLIQIQGFHGRNMAKRSSTP